ncbi:MAG TPA: hypothetical protein VFP33_06800 [Gallionella sp.]|nr:hypothetical protein [Gallionella sp.]
MKPNVLFACFLLFISTSVLAAPDPNNCYSGSMQLKPSERDAYIESCMAMVSAPANVQEEFHRSKLRFCEQNVKNMKLRGDTRSNYIDTCMNSNEAEVAAKEADAKQTNARQAATTKQAALQSGKCACASNDKTMSSASKSARHPQRMAVECKQLTKKKSRSGSRGQPTGGSSKA